MHVESWTGKLHSVVNGAPVPNGQILTVLTAYDAATLHGKPKRVQQSIIMAAADFIPSGRVIRETVRKSGNRQFHPNTYIVEIVTV